MIREVLKRLWDMCCCCLFRDHSRDDSMRNLTIRDYHELLIHYKKQLEEQRKNKLSCC